MNKGDIMTNRKGLVFFNNMSKLLFHHVLCTQTETHTHTQMNKCARKQSYLISTCTLTFCLKENKLNGK